MTTTLQFLARDITLKSVILSGIPSNIGGVSGGTIASVMNIFSTASADSLKAASNPFYLAPRDALSNPIQATDPAVVAANGDTSGFFYDKIEGKARYPQPSNCSVLSA